MSLNVVRVSVKSEALKDEAVKRVIGPALGVKDEHSASIVRAEEARLLQDFEVKMVGAAACGTNAVTGTIGGHCRGISFQPLYGCNSGEGIQCAHGCNSCG